MYTNLIDMLRNTSGSTSVCVHDRHEDGDCLFFFNFDNDHFNDASQEAFLEAMESAEDNDFYSHRAGQSVLRARIVDVLDLRQVGYVDGYRVTIL